MGGPGGGRSWGRAVLGKGGPGRGGRWVLVVGRWVLGVGCWVLGVGCWVLGVGVKLVLDESGHGMKVVLDESGFGMKVVLDESGFGMKVVLGENFWDKKRQVHPNLDETVPNPCAHRSKCRLDKQVDFTLCGAEGRHMDIIQVISLPMHV